MDVNFLKYALSLFQADSQPAERLRGGTVSQVYQFSSQGMPYVLRLTPPEGGIGLQDMESILHYMQTLADGGLSVPRPLGSLNGQLVEEIRVDEALWLASAVQKARGVRAETIPFEGWTDRRIHLLGALAGRMHGLSRAYRPSAGINPRPAWHETVNNYNPLDELDDAEPEILQRRDEALEYINALPKDQPSFGLIHADLQFANFFIDPADDTLTLYDFDDCCYGWYLMDVALPLLDMLVLYPGHDRQAFAARFLEHFISGYRSQCTLDPACLAELPAFLKLLEIGLYLQVAAYSADASADSWVGKFIQGRRENILARAAFVPLYFPV